MRPFTLKTFFILLVLAGAVCLTTGIDQYIHILVCHHESHCHTDSPADNSSGHSDSEEQHCPVCQFFVSGQNLSVACECCELIINPAPALWGMPENTITLVTETVYDKISRAPPFAC
jgi:hypothetical protein